MNLVFMGTPEFSAYILRQLARHHKIALVFTQADKKVGRKGILTPPPVKFAANELGIEIYQPERLKDNAQAVEKIRSINPDYIIVAAYGKILPKSILDIAPCINTHASLLPKYRGASPIQTAIKNAESVSGMSIMYMDEGLDTGDVIMQEQLNISGKNASEVFENMAILGANMLIEFLANPLKFTPIKQNHSLATHCGIIKKQDGVVDFSDAKTLYQKYLAFYMWPNIYLASGLKLCDVALIESSSTNTAGVIKKIDQNGIELACEKGSILIKSVQPAGKKQMSARDYANGKRLEIGQQFS